MINHSSLDALALQRALQRALSRDAVSHKLAVERRKLWRKLQQNVDHFEFSLELKKRGRMFIFQSIRRSRCNFSFLIRRPFYVCMFFFSVCERRVFFQSHTCTPFVSSSCLSTSCPSMLLLSEYKSLMLRKMNECSLSVHRRCSAGSHAYFSHIVWSDRLFFLFFTQNRNIS